MTLDEVAGRLSQAKPHKHQGLRGYKALCPCHDDSTPSAEIWEGENGWIQFKCRSCGADSKQFVSSIGISNADLRYRDDPSYSKKVDKKWTPPDEEYHYRRADGSYLFTKMRWGSGKGKRIVQVIKDSPSGRVIEWNLNSLPEDEKHTLYNLPEVIEAVRNGTPVHIGEGEKAANALTAKGEVATCQPLGAECGTNGKCRWLDSHSALFAGAMPIIWADNDEKGQWYACEVAHSLKQAGAAPIVVMSRTGGPKDDAFDHLEAGFGPYDGEPIDDSRRTAPEKNPVPVAMSAVAEVAIEVQLEGRDRPQIPTTFVQYRDTMNAVMGAIVARNDPPTLFVRNGTLALVARHGDNDYKIIDAMDHDIRALASNACDFVKWSEKKNDFIPSDPPGKVEAMVRASRPWKDIPEVEGISGCPVLRSDGTFATDTGYDADTRAYVIDGPWPCSSAMSDPVSWLLTEALGEFPFDDDASRDNALALMLLPFVRRIIKCPTPVHYIEAPVVGTGKSLLAQTCLYPACGFVGTSTLPEREEERKKSISSFLLEGAPAIIFDNVDKRVDSGTLAAATTNARYHDRMLGSNSIIDVPVKCVWVMTGNNAELSSDMMRRTVLIRIDANMERPSQGRSFKKDLTKWCEENRRDCVAACCQAVTNWIDAGRPMFTDRAMGGFEDHSRIIGGILMANGLTSFIGNRARLEAHADPDSQGWASFHESVYETYGNSWWRVGEVIEKADAIEELGQFMGTNPDGKKHKFGKALKKRDGTVASELRLVTGRDSHTKTACYRVVPTMRHPKYDPFDEPSDPIVEDRSSDQQGLPYKDD